MKTFVFAGMLIVSLILLSCGGDEEPEPYPDITGLEADIKTLQADIKELQTSIAQGTPPPVIEGAVPVEIKDPVEEVQDRTGGLPPSGEPTGDPVDDPLGGVPAFGEGRIVFSRGDGIYIMGSNGAGVELVVAPELGFRDPALSPDGRERCLFYAESYDVESSGRGEAHQKRCRVYHREPRTWRVFVSCMVA